MHTNFSSKGFGVFVLYTPKISRKHTTTLSHHVILKCCISFIGEHRPRDVDKFLSVSFMGPKYYVKNLAENESDSNVGANSLL